MHEREREVNGRGAAVYTAEDSRVGGNGKFMDGKRGGRVDCCDAILESEPGLDVDSVL